MRIYFISGLGADKRTFKKLRLPHSFSVSHIDWIEPLPNETLSDYCLRLSKSIDTSEDFALIGLSFGGIVATELSKFIKPKQIILISSVSTKSELPWIYQSIGFCGLHKAAPLSLLSRKPSPIICWLFGAKGKEEKNLLKQILIGTSPTFLRWAIDKIVTWTNRKRPENVYHIHGTADKILPCRRTKAEYKIKGGEHLMVYTEADLISSLIAEKLKC